MIKAEWQEEKAYLQKRLNRKSYRSEAEEKIIKYVEYKKLSLNQSLEALKIMTNVFFFKFEPYSEYNFDRTLASSISSVINKLNDHYEEKPALHRYFNNVELMIDGLGSLLQPEKKIETLLMFAECLREISNETVFYCDDYNGRNIKVSGRILDHERSVLITPSDPTEAVASLFKRPSLRLFAEYNSANSAEKFINEYYGTDGLFAEHYRAILNCKTRYPLQTQGLTSVAI